MAPVLSSVAGDHLELTPAIFCVIGLAFAALGLVMLARQRRFAHRSARTTGTVADYARGAGAWAGFSANGPLFYPVVRFATANGQAVEVRSPTGTSWRPYQVGQTVPVLYDPANPRDARIDTFLATGCLPVAFIVLGAVLVALDIAVLWVMQWWAHNGPPL